jgi:EmrB/QacA subfamily drug resistance transporter
MTSTSKSKEGFSAWQVLTMCAVAQFMVVLDVSIVNVALPAMRQNLGLSVTGQEWVVNAYTLTFAGFLLLGGRAADLFGRRRVFMVGLSVFTLSSLLGGLAQSGAWLVAARGAQGLGGAILAPTSLTILTSTFTDMAQRRRALGIWSATASSGAAAGVLLGGVLTDLLNWRWVLIVNVPIGLVMLVAATRVLPESRQQGARRRLDVEGAFTITAGLALLVYGIVSTDTHSWGSTVTLISLLGGLGFLIASLFIEARYAETPLVPLSIFKRRSLSASNGIALTIGAALFGMYFFVSLYLQQVVGYSPLRTGLAILPAGLMTLGAALLAPRLVAKIGAKRQLVLGPSLAGIGLVWMSFLSFGGAYWTHMFGPLVVFGLGIGTSFVPMTLTATAGVPVEQAGLASGLINTTRQMGGALGLAILATIAASATRAQRLVAPSFKNALTMGYDRAFLIAGIALFVGAGLALFIESTASGQSSSGSIVKSSAPVVDVPRIPSDTPKGPVANETSESGLLTPPPSNSGDEVYSAYLSLGGNEGRPVSAKSIARVLAPELNDQIMRQRSLGLDSTDWLTESVVSLLELAKRHGNLAGVGEGNDLVVTRWEMNASAH